MNFLMFSLFILEISLSPLNKGGELVTLGLYPVEILKLRWESDLHF